MTEAENKIGEMNYFPDRFDKVYLQYLADQLLIENLIANSIERVKEIGGIKFTRCITIDFCGIAASTLLNSDFQGNDIGRENIEERKKVSSAFAKLFDPSVIKILNDEGVYLRIRFCFAYLYSDYPMCLIKAEQADIWQNLIEAKSPSYFRNLPLTMHQFQNSKIHRSQIEALDSSPAFRLNR